MINKLLLILCSLFVLLSCSSDDRERKLVVEDIVPDLSIEEFSDSSFFSDIRGMEFSDGNLFVSDYKRAQIFTLDQDLNMLKYFGSIGQAPGEIMDLTAFDVSGENIAVFDYLKRAYHIFDLDGKYGYSINKPKAANPRTRKFVFGDGSILDCALRDSALISFEVKDTSKKEFFGERYEFNSENQNRIRNGRYIYQNKKHIIAVSDNMPFIEKYDLKGKLIEKYDLSSIDLVKKQLEYISQKKRNNDLSYSMLIKGAYLNKDRLYVIVNTHINEEYFSNIVIEFDVKKGVRPLRAFKLPKDVYSSLCANDEYLFVFNYSLCALERYKL